LAAVTIDDTTIGGTTAASGAFTTLTASGALSVDAEAISQIKSGVASDVLRLGNDAGTFVLGYAASLASMDLGASDNFRIRHGSVESFRATSSGVVLNEVSSSSVDFRVESDSNTHMLFVDAGNDRVGVGTAPSYTFHVSGSDPILSLNDTGANSTRLQLQSTNTAIYYGTIYSSTNPHVIWTVGGATPSAGSEVFRITNTADCCDSLTRLLVIKTSASRVTR
jgi:hypothetical protein